MTAKAEKLNKLINAIPETYPASMREPIRDLVAGITDEKLREETYRVGDRFIRDSTGVEYIIASGGGCKVQAINLRSGYLRNSGVMVGDSERITEKEIAEVLNSKRTKFTKIKR